MEELKICLEYCDGDGLIIKTVVHKDGTMKNVGFKLTQSGQFGRNSPILHIYADNVQWMTLTKQLVHHMYFKRYAVSKVPAEYSCILQKCNGNNDKC